MNEPQSIHEVIGGPPPESDDFLPSEGPKNVRARIKEVLGESNASMVLMEPPDVFDSCIVGLCLVLDMPRAVYNEQAVIAALAKQLGCTAMEAFDTFDRKRNEYGQGELAGPIFMTDILDVVF